MSNFSLIEGGKLPVSLTSPEGMVKFKSLVSKIKAIFNDKVGEGPRPYFLHRLEEAKDIPDIIFQLMGYSPANVLVIDDFVALTYALNGLLEHCGKRDTPYLDINVENDGVHFEVHFIHSIVDFDRDAIVEEFNELSDANQDVQSESMKRTIEEHVEKLVDSASVENPDYTFETPTLKNNDEKPDEGEWITAGKSKKMSPVEPTTTVKVKDSLKDQNRFHALEDEHNDNVTEKFENFDSSKMEQSMESVASLESPKKKKSDRQKLLDRPDRKYRKKGWAQINRIVEKGDVDSLSIDDLCFYICFAGPALRQSKKDQISNFSEVLEQKGGKYRIKVEKECNDLVDKACATLAKEDAAIFNKIRTNKNQIEAKINEAKIQVQKQVKINETSHAVIADIESRLTKGMDLSSTVKDLNSSVVTLMTKINALEERVDQQQKRIDEQQEEIDDLQTETDVHQKGVDKLPTIEEAQEDHQSKIDDHSTRLDTHAKSIKNLEEAQDNYNACSRGFENASYKTDRKGESGFNTPPRDAVPDDVPSSPMRQKAATAEPTIPFGSRVLLKNGVMRECRAYVMNVTSYEGKNLYHAQTAGQTNIFVRYSEVMTVLVEGDKNAFTSGYDPTRSLAIFDTYISQVKSTATPARKQRTPKPALSQTKSGAPYFSANRNTDSLGQSRRYQVAPSNPHDLDDEDQQDNFFNRPLADYEYIYPTGTAPKRVLEDKVEQVHSNMRVTLSDESKIQSFYEDIRRRLKPQNIPIKDWLQLTPQVDILDLPSGEVQNYDRAKVVMSRAIYNLLDANKDELVTDSFMQGELQMYSAESDGFGFLRFMVSQTHPKFRHEITRPSITATLQPPAFTDDNTIYEFCTEVQEYMTNGNAPDHFTPLAAAQFVAESLRRDTRFNKGRIALEQEISNNLSSSGYVPAHLAVRALPRTILNVYEPHQKRELSKPKRSSATQFNASRLETPFCVGVDEIEELVMNRVNTRSGAGGNENRKTYSRTNDRTSNYNRNDKDNGNVGNGRYQRNQPHGERNGYQRRNGKQQNDSDDIPFIQCTACGGPGHEEKDCKKKLSFVRLSQWMAMLSPAQRKEFSSELDRNARATHERYKAAYKNRKDIRKRVNKIDIDDESRVMLLSAYRTQLPDMDFGSLDIDLVDDLEPCLDFNPDTDNLSE